jgi:hypothetical protein
MFNARRLFLILILIATLVGCSSNEATPPAADDTILTISDGNNEKSYTLAELQGLPETGVESDDGSFVGVRLIDLLVHAGYDPDAITSVRVVALDGFSSTYDSELFKGEDTVLAYAREDQVLNGDELPLRMVIPGQEGRMQPRQVQSIEVTTP